MTSHHEKKRIEQLVRRAQNGDVVAFSKLYDLFTQTVYRFIAARVYHKEDAQDIVAETWKKIWVNLKRYKTGNFKGYIFRVAYTTLLTHVSKSKKTESLEDYSLIPSKDLFLDKQLEKKEEIGQLYKALKQLPRDYAAVVTLRFIEGFSIEETAAILKKSSIMIRVTQYRAMKKLRDLLK